MDLQAGQALPLKLQGTTPPKGDALRDVAKKLESAFLAEMLQHAGFGESRSTFGGGIGEDQFSSFLVREQADALVDAGGLGLAESLFEALKEREK